MTAQALYDRTFFYKVFAEESRRRATATAQSHFLRLEIFLCGSFFLLVCACIVVQMCRCLCCPGTASMRGGAEIELSTDGSEEEIELVRRGSRSGSDWDGYAKV